jgi:hypothetical protein
VRHIPSGVTYDPVPLPTPNVSFLPRAAESAVVNKYKYMLNNKATQRKRNNKRNLPNIDVTLPGWFTIEHSKLLSSAY